MTTEISHSTTQNTDSTSQLEWTFLTNHAHVLLILAHDQNLVLREVAERIGITERAVQRIVSELEKAGYISRNKVGRQNSYKLNLENPNKNVIEKNFNLSNLFKALLSTQ